MFKYTESHLIWNICGSVCGLEESFPVFHFLWKQHYIKRWTDFEQFLY